MLDRGMLGWVLVTVALGHDPNDQGPGDERRFLGDFRRLSDRGLGVIVRLNNGYGSAGTLPYARHYDDFARRCANFVRMSKGASLWIVGNETNHPVEWPGADWDWSAVPPRPRRPDSTGEPITPQLYAACYSKVRTAIKALSGHQDDQVLLAGVAPWNNLLTYDGNGNGDWVKYFADILKLLGPTGCDGITLHAYTHGTAPELVKSTAKVGDARYNSYHWHFRTYQDFMQAIPSSMHHLPVYVTETDQGDVPWHNANTGWVREAYKEINEWNQREEQQIRALILYRWPKVGEDRWWIEGKQGVIEDFQQSFAAGYKWSEGPPAPDYRELEQQINALVAEIAALKDELAALASNTAEAAALQQTINQLANDAKQGAEVGQQVEEIGREVARLETAVRILGSGDVAQPEMLDKRDTLPVHPTNRYPSRALNTIVRIVVHHTATRPDISPEQVAQFHVGQGFAGIKYHFMINGDGTTTWTQPLESAVAQTSVNAINAEAVAVTLAGNFTRVAPDEVQLNSAARLIAWLLSTLQLTTSAVYGRSELDPSDPSLSPGKQWMEEARYKDTLLAAVQVILDEAAAGQDELIAELRQRIKELERRVAELEDQAGQVPALQEEIRALRQEVDALKAEVSRLQAENSQLLAENARLWAIIQGQQGGSVARPAVLDVVDELVKHPTLRYENRTQKVSAVVVHHTDTPNTTTVEQIAHYHVFGTRRDSNGNLIKAEWPGIAYHYVIRPDGVIYWCQRHETRSYHARDANNYAVGVSMIGRFTGGGLPTEEQMRSVSHLIAWLMQEEEITDVQRIVGHKEVSVTTCPGDQWMKGVVWKNTLHERVLAVAAAGGRPIEYCLLFWDHGHMWAEADFRNAQGYIAHFRPAILFSTDEALAAQHVVIVGGDAGVSGEDEARLRNAGVNVYRLAGANEAETKAMLDELVANETPYPGAPKHAPLTRGVFPSSTSDVPAEPVRGLGKPIQDEWTIPDDWEPPPPSQQQRVKLDTLTAPQVSAGAPAPWEDQVAP